MTGRHDKARGDRRVHNTVADALPGQTLTLFLALIAAGAIAIGATAFGVWPGSNTPAAATGSSNTALRVVAETGDGADGTVRDTTKDSADDPVVTSASPEPVPPQVDQSTGKSVPLTDADKEFLVKVKQAGLWEIPTGEQAQEKASSPRVKEVGRQLAADHRKLDKAVNALAGELGVPLPTVPSKLQQGWMAELLKQPSGTGYDKLFADRLRAAHGTVFNIIAQVRTGTRNPLIRQFAQTANTVVMRHMTLLESTGYVNYSDLPAPVLSQAAANTNTSSGSTGTGSVGSPGMRTVLIVAMLAAAALIGMVSIRRVRRGE
ncbi:DUF4142 domain-containing protein [Cryptosporangium phraense]|uniref:DUF4142 domain-containing protein n=1 Tax=Cryptosporangium phraense TaxID=2593070 RepID=A0A545AVQ0_9ACTN|nr:DUF4142 domain-containing protein [Cryptosporangium phraense]TQS45418.1 DUF4142 domain-containing protein [Cryptosporangium phraense]